MIPILAAELTPAANDIVLIGGLIVGAGGVFWFLNQGAEFIERMKGNEHFVKSEICKLIHKQIGADLKEMKADVKKLLQRTAHMATGTTDDP